MTRLRITLALFLVYMIFAVLMNSVGTVILQSISTFGVAKSDAALLEACKDLPIAFVSFLAASFLPRLGYRRAMIVALLAVAGGCAAMPIVQAFWMTRLLFVTIGISFALAKISVYSTIGLLTSDRRGHASLTGYLEGFFMLGVLSGYWLFSAFIDPHAQGSRSWLNVYWVVAATAVATALLLSVSRLDEGAATRAGEGLKAQLASMPRLLAERFLPPFLLSAFLYVLVEQSLGTWLPTFNNEVLKLSPAMSVQATSLFAAALALGRLGGGAVLQRVSWLPVLLVCVGGMVLTLVLALPLAHAIHGAPTSWLDAPLAAWTLPLVGLFMAPIYPTVNSAVLSALPAHRHSAMTGLIVVFSALGGTFGSFVTGNAFRLIGGEKAFYLTLGPIALLALALLLFSRALPRTVPTEVHPGA